LLASILKTGGILLPLLACSVGVAFGDIESPKYPLEPAALDISGIRELQQTDPNLTGTGIVIAAVCRSMSYLNGLPQNDYRFNMHHTSLAGANVLFDDHSDGLDGISSHATAIGGILIGLDPQAHLPDNTGFEYRGVCPSASVEVYEFWRFAALRLFAKKPIPADVITLSLGDLFEDWWTRAIERVAAEQGTIIVASIGNGHTVKDPLLYPAAGANVIGVGTMRSAVNPDGSVALDRFIPPTVEISSGGPTEDLRSKPDLIAPGSAIVPQAFSEDGYTTVTNATSLAAPLTAGAAALLLQYAYEDPTLSAELVQSPLNCVIKAVLMNSAKKLPYWHKGWISEEDDQTSPLDRLQGAGALDAAAAKAQLAAGKQPPGEVRAIGWDSRSLSQMDTFLYLFESPDPNAVLTATLTWNRHYEDSYPFRAKTQQSDLRLELWAFDPNVSNEMVLIDVSDSPVDTVEHLWTPLSSGYTWYALAVQFSPESKGLAPEKEPFALAWSVGPDRSLGDRMWQDINGDGQINHLDSFIQLLLKSGHLSTLDSNFYKNALGLSPERFEVLTTLRHRWLPYLKDSIKPLD
jgi:hypothetical protein